MNVNRSQQRSSPGGDTIASAQWPPTVRIIGCCWGTLLSGIWLAVAVGPANAQPASLRPAWNESRFVGSPDPPLPYVLEKAYPFEFRGPISLHRIPGTELMLVLEQHGQMHVFDARDASTPPKMIADLNATPPPHTDVESLPGRRVELFSLDFHPQFQHNGFVFVAFVTVGGGQPTRTHIARFPLQLRPEPRLDVAAGLPVLECEGGGHNGCTVAFGPDGMLYISLGDLTSPTPPDERDTGQDISDLYASILRIDVDHPDAGRNYGIPPDNPFVNLPGARGEVYAFGFRNPFRMSFDPVAGDLWVGDVGWEAWEMVYRVRRGGNYGWAIKEGPGDAKTTQPPGPGPILPADVALSHAEAASVTGGLVYRGSRYPDLHGQYIFGDWITRRFWAVRADGQQVLEVREIASGTVKPVCFASDPDGELLVLDYAAGNQPGAIYRLVPNPARNQPAGTFPRRLSTCGLFRDVRAHHPAEGVTAYRINAPAWKDGAVSTYLLGIPGREQAVFYQRPKTMFDWFKTSVELPRGTVLAKTYALPHSDGSGSLRRIETQVSFKDRAGQWQYYTYAWNDAETDAELVPAAGATRQVRTINPRGAPEEITWQFDSRSNCRICHTPWMGETLGFIEAQLRSPKEDDDAWRELMAGGFIVAAAGEEPLADDRFAGLVDPSDTRHPLPQRARSYLHTNCAHCHLFGGNASTHFDVSFPKRLEDTHLVGIAPMRGALGLPAASPVALVQPGRPDRSVLWYRMAKVGAGRMPHIGSQWVDPQGVQLVFQWIASMPPDPKWATALDAVSAPGGQADEDGRRLAAIDTLLDDPTGAAYLLAAIERGDVARRWQAAIVQASRSRPPLIQDLFESLADPTEKTPRLGESIDPAVVLAVPGDALRGRRLFMAGVGNCTACHRVEGVGTALGPNLVQAVQRLETPQRVLQAILDPSAEIQPEFQSWTVLTGEGVVTGLKMDQSPDAITLRGADGQIRSISKGEIEAIRPNAKSLMPTNLLASLTRQQAADLLAYLMSLHTDSAATE
ncbi:MAG: hypothetical protein D6753_15255 [Planctomycetota bacterium]|nr:MAG: hypothetical protein D6753_15255 [Planctomycetota bacterium]